MPSVPALHVSSTLRFTTSSPSQQSAAAAASSATEPNPKFAAKQYDPVFQQSITDPNGYWLKHADLITWSARGKQALTKTGPRPYDYRWYADGWKLNACENMLDVHVKEGRGDKVALIYDSAVAPSGSRKITYKEMLSEVSRLAGALVAAGVKKGDRVLIYMPMIPETVFGILACARIGAIHGVVFGGFPAAELAKRINDASPKVVLTASCGLEGMTKIIPYKPALDEALRMSKCPPPEKVLVFQREQLKAELTDKKRDVDWVDFVKKEGKETAPVQLNSTDPLYILYTSGTTGLPKGVVRDVGSIVAMKASMDIVYSHPRDSVWWSASDLGWAVGHSYIVYAPLLQGTTSVLFEGKPVGTPDPGTFWRVISQHKVEALFTAPTALRAIKKEDAEGAFLKKYDVSHFRKLFLAGERADPASITWARSKLNVPVIDHWWQTETGWTIAGNPTGIQMLPVKDGAATKAMVGWDVRVLNDDGEEVPHGTQGNLVVKLPLPPSGLHELWNNQERFVKSYMSRFPGYYDTADAGMIDADGYVYVMARSDDVMNVAGHRLSSGQMEEVLQEHPAVAESAVVAVPDELRGHVPLGIVVLKSQSSGAAKFNEAQIEKEVVAAVRERVGAVACFRRLIVVPRLPKTRSGKLLRNVLRAMAEGRAEIPVPPTIEDASVLAEVREVMNKNRIGTLPAKK